MSAFQPVAPNGKDPAKKEEKAEKPIDTLRGQMRDALPQIPQLDNLIRIVADATQARRKIRIVGQECQKCGHSCNHVRYYEFDDPKTARETLTWLADQLEGKPGTAEAGSQGIVVNWGIVGVDE